MGIHLNVDVIQLVATGIGIHIRVLIPLVILQQLIPRVLLQQHVVRASGNAIMVIAYMEATIVMVP